MVYDIWSYATVVVWNRRLHTTMHGDHNLMRSVSLRCRSTSLMYRRSQSTRCEANGLLACSVSIINILKHSDTYFEELSRVLAADTTTVDAVITVLHGIMTSVRWALQR